MTDVFGQGSVVEYSFAMITMLTRGGRHQVVAAKILEEEVALSFGILCLGMGLYNLCS